MADRVVIIDCHRANEPVPVYELKQMMGRVSRGGDTKAGHVDFVVGCTKSDYLEKQVKNGMKYNVQSQLVGEMDQVCFHVISEICNGRINQIDDIQKWYDRSLSKFQGNTLDTDEVINTLKSYDSIMLLKRNIVPTILGQLSSRLYFTPKQIFEWVSNFEEIFANSDEPDTFSLCWALSNISSAPNGWIPKDLAYVQEEFLSQCGSFMWVKESCVKQGMCWWNLMNGPSVRDLKSHALELKKEWNRIYRVLRLANKYKKWKKNKIIENINIRIQNRIGVELVELCRLGFNKTCAEELYNTYGITSLSEVKERISDILTSENQVLLDSVGRIIDEHRDKFSTKSIESLLGSHE